MRNSVPPRTCVANGVSSQCEQLQLAARRRHAGSLHQLFPRLTGLLTAVAAGTIGGQLRGLSCLSAPIAIAIAIAISVSIPARGPLVHKRWRRQHFIAFRAGSGSRCGGSDTDIVQ